MKFNDLIKPKPSISFWIGNLLIDINFARTWTWCEQNEDNTERTTRLFSIHFIQKYIDKQQLNALVFILIPLKLTLGWK